MFKLKTIATMNNPSFIKGIVTIANPFDITICGAEADNSISGQSLNYYFKESLKFNRE